MTVDQYQAAVGLYSSSSPRLTRLGTNRLRSTVGMNRHGHGVVCAPRSGRVIVVVRTVTVNSSRHVDQLRVATVQCQQRHTRGSTDCTVTTSSSRRLMEALADRLHRPLCIHTHTAAAAVTSGQIILIKGHIAEALSQKLTLPLGRGSGPLLIRGSLVHATPRPKRHLDRSDRFSTSHGNVQQTDHGTALTVGCISCTLCLRCGLTTSDHSNLTHGSSQMTTERSLGIGMLKRLHPGSALWFSAAIRVIQVSMPLREIG